MKIRLFQALFLMLLIVSCRSSDGHKEEAPDNLAVMAGQMIMAGFRGFTGEDSPEIIRTLHAGAAGGIILYDWDAALNTFDRNIRSPGQLSALIETLNRESSTPLFIAIDQEGGRVNRLKEKYGFPASVSQQYLGEKNSEELTRKTAAETAGILKKLGINVNFAPCTDLNLNPSNPVIARYERSFSSDPSLVTAHSRRVLEEFEKHQILGVVKHFPGHGSSREDSHQEMTDVTDTWQEIELEPYRQLIAENKVSMIMTAHLYQRHLDPDYPATLSFKILTGLLREKLGFQGVIITDDMNMKAITRYYGFETAIERAVNAGADILLYGNNMDYEPEIALKVQKTIVRLTLEGKISRSRLEESYQRIRMLKSRMRLKSSETHTGE